MADDGFEVYFTEKLWEMIPAVYRHEDGLGENPGVLRALVEVLARQAAILRRSHDRLWEDQFIELCDEWTVPYLGDLVGTRLVSALNRRGRRVDVGKTISYRRRTGTLAVLEELISDITRWEGTVVEQFRRLGRARHRLDPAPGPLVGRFTGTPPGGWADLRRPRGAELAGGPFDEFHHTPDVRRHRGVEGRYNISKIAFHLYRLSAYQVSGVTPYPVDPEKGRYTFDPSGRDIPLFMPRSRPQDPRAPNEAGRWDRWRPAREWELSAPMRCRVLGHAEYEIDQDLIGELEAEGVLTPSQVNELRRLRGQHFSDEPFLRRALQALPNGEDFLEADNFIPLAGGALTADCGKAHLLFRALQVVAGGELLPIVPEPGGDLEDEKKERRKLQRRRARMAAANLSAWPSSTSYGLVIDPDQGRFILQEEMPEGDLTVAYHYGFSGEIGAGTYHRAEVEQSEADLKYSAGGAIRSAEVIGEDAEARLVVQIEDSATYGPVDDITIDRASGIQELVLQAANRQRPYLQLAGSEEAETDWVLDTEDNEEVELVLDGLWIGSQQPGRLILRGDYEKVILRHVTLDPGGERRIKATGDMLPAITLVVEANIDLLKIDSSITGPIEINGTVEKLVIRDSIVQFLAADATDLILERATVFGSLSAHRLWATEALITHNVRVTDVQTGCFRFGAALSGSRLPEPYESHRFEDFNHFFTSQRFGNPGYAQLSEAAPEAVRRGAENTSEIGAFSRLLNPIQLESLRTKVAEFSPFGLIPIYIYET